MTRKCVDCGDEQQNSGPIFVVIILMVVNLVIYIPKMKGPARRLYLKYQYVVNYGAILFITWQSELRRCPLLRAIRCNLLMLLAQSRFHPSPLFLTHTHFIPHS